MEGSFRRPRVAGSPRRRSRSPTPGTRSPNPNDAGQDYGSEAASRFEPATAPESYVPVAYPVAEVAPPAETGRMPAAAPYFEEDR